MGQGIDEERSKSFRPRKPPKKLKPIGQQSCVRNNVDRPGRRARQVVRSQSGAWEGEKNFCKVRPAETQRHERRGHGLTRGIAISQIAVPSQSSFIGVLFMVQRPGTLRKLKTPSCSIKKDRTKADWPSQSSLGKGKMNSTHRGSISSAKRRPPAKVVTSGGRNARPQKIDGSLENAKRVNQNGAGKFVIDYQDVPALGALSTKKRKNFFGMGPHPRWGRSFWGNTATLRQLILCLTSVQERQTGPAQLGASVGERKTFSRAGDDETQSNTRVDPDRLVVEGSRGNEHVGKNAYRLGYRGGSCR